MSEVMIDGKSYVVTPKTYVRSNDHYDGVESGIWHQRDFVGGQLRAFQLEQDRGWSGLSVGPALLGQGIEPWPYSAPYTDAAIATATTVRIPSLVLNDNAYMAIGRYLYKSVSLSAGTWANWTQVYDAGAGNTITHLAHHLDRVICCINNGVAMNAHTPGSPGSNAAWMASQIGWRAVGYAGQLIWAHQANPAELRISLTSSTHTTRQLDSDIAMMCLHDGQVAIATRTSLYMLGGRADPLASPTAWIGEPVPFFTHGTYTDEEDFQFLISFGGKLYTWLGNEVMEWNSRSDRAGWRATGLSGQSCHGATVAGNWMVVAITTRSGTYEVWAFDGIGWWRIYDHASQARVWPTYVGGAGNLDVICFRAGSGSGIYDTFRLVYRHSAAQTYPASGNVEYVTSMIDANHPELYKSWKQFGLTVATPEIRGNPASVAPVGMTLHASIDGGASWTLIGSTLLLAATTRVRAMTFGVITPLIGSHIQFRVSWSGVTDWAPVVSNLWASWHSINHPSPSRRWTMSLRAGDRQVKSDGTIDSRTGKAISDDLWTALLNNAPVTFRDIDYAVTGIEYSVTIVGISEDVPHPDKTAAWHEASFKIQLSET